MLRSCFVTFLLLVTGCAASAEKAATPPVVEAPVVGAGKMQLLVTVDWEGRDLREANLQAMRDLHTRFPQVKIVHFLNAAYFVKDGANEDDATAKIASTIAPGDERGLHIHGWKRLFEAAGVTFRATPTFFGTPLVMQQCMSSDCGHEVPISEYSVSELRKVVRFSLDTLESQGFGGAKMQSFRCGGWMAKDSVRQAVAAEGLTFEQSAVPVPFLEPKLGAMPLHEWLTELWPSTTETSQPFTMKTPAGDLVEVPDNGALADYVDADQMMGTFEANKSEYLRLDRKKNVVVSVGFHQETASMFLPRLEAALERMFDASKRDGIPFVSVTTPELSKP